ncbi:hypothetical protein EJ08DRAFT_193124 [Tothia fuscella]|uniref:Uncharacterized protein n=1 Tax=Tothia fuscella TaxID=1048955 RepID=A0A9P4TYA7_9PEZI|nr:hypothetical protein EJ08DRAFT_193124 [Tothia fuscella]
MTFDKKVFDSDPDYPVSISSTQFHISNISPRRQSTPDFTAAPSLSSLGRAATRQQLSEAMPFTEPRTFRTGWESYDSEYCIPRARMPQVPPYEHFLERAREHAGSARRQRRSNQGSYSSKRVRFEQSTPSFGSLSSTSSRPSTSSSGSTFRRRLSNTFEYTRIEPEFINDRVQPYSFYLEEARDGKRRNRTMNIIPSSTNNNNANPFPNSLRTTRRPRRLQNEPAVSPRQANPPPQLDGTTGLDSPIPSGSSQRTRDEAPGPYGRRWSRSSSMAGNNSQSGFLPAAPVENEFTNPQVPSFNYFLQDAQHRSRESLASRGSQPRSSQQSPTHSQSPTLIPSTRNSALCYCPLHNGLAPHSFSPQTSQPPVSQSQFPSHLRRGSPPSTRVPRKPIAIQKNSPPTDFKRKPLLPRMNTPPPVAPRRKPIPNYPAPPSQVPRAFRRKSITADTGVQPPAARSQRKPLPPLPSKALPPPRYNTTPHSNPFSTSQPSQSNSSLPFTPVPIPSRRLDLNPSHYVGADIIHRISTPERLEAARLEAEATTLAMETFYQQTSAAGLGSKWSTSTSSSSVYSNDGRPGRLFKRMNDSIRRRTRDSSRKSKASGSGGVSRSGSVKRSDSVKRSGSVKRSDSTGSRKDRSPRKSGRSSGSGRLFTFGGDRTPSTSRASPERVAQRPSIRRVHEDGTISPRSASVSASGSGSWTSDSRERQSSEGYRRSEER